MLHWLTFSSIPDDAKAPAPEAAVSWQSLIRGDRT